MKKLILVLGGLGILGIAAITAMIFLLPDIIQSHDFKPRIIEIVKQQTGRDLVIEGDLDIRIFPKIGVALGKTQLSNAAGFGEQPFVSMDAVNIQLALLPLLKGQVQMDEIVVDGLFMNLYRNKAGRTNWDDFSKGTDMRAEPPPPSPVHDGAGMQLDALYIGGINIRDAQISWRDDTAGDDYRISELNLSGGAIMPGQPVDIDFSARFDSQRYQVQGIFKFGGNILLSETSQSITIGSMVLDMDVETEKISLKKSSLNITSEQMTFDINSQKLESGRLAVMLDFDLSDPALKARIDAQVDAALDLNAKQYSLADLVAEIDASGKSPNNGKARLKLEFPVLTAELGSSQSAGLQGQLRIAEFNARQLLEISGQPVPEAADLATLTRVQADFDFMASGRKIAINQLNIAVDDTTLKGKANVTDLSRQAVTFELDIDKIDLDRYLPPKKEESDTRPRPTGADTTGDEPLFPVTALKELDTNGVVRIADLKVHNMQLDDIRLELQSGDGYLNLKSKAGLYQGEYSGDFTLNVRPELPVVEIESGFNNIQIEPLLQDLTGEARLAGTTRGSVKVNSRGNSRNALEKTLNGDASFNFSDGAIVGVNIGKILREGMSRLEGKAIQQTDVPGKTDFSQLSGNATIKSGVVTNKDLSMKSPLLRAAGGGTIDLPEKHIDYLLEVSLVGTLQGQGGEDLSRLRGITIPLRISGPFSELSYKPDLSAALSGRAREKVQEKKDELKDKLKGKLKGLF